MTTSGGTGPASMRYQLHEVLVGMLASIEADRFRDDAQKLAAMFEDLAGRFPLFAPLAVAVDPAAIQDALRALETNKYLEHGEGHYTLTPAGRAHCVSTKRMLFNLGDREQLEQAARAFDTL
jgi:hypothetical protein